MAKLQQSTTVESFPSQKTKRPKASDDYLRRLPWVFLAPALLIYSVVVVYPMLYSAYLSLFRWDGIAPTKVFVGLNNYVELLTQTMYSGSLLKTTLSGWWQLSSCRQALA